MEGKSYKGMKKVDDGGFVSREVGVFCVHILVLSNANAAIWENAVILQRKIAETFLINSGEKWIGNSARFM